MTEMNYASMAEAIADLMGDHGFAFVENDKLPALAVTLRGFLEAAGLPINPPQVDS